MREAAGSALATGAPVDDPGEPLAMAVVAASGAVSLPLAEVDALRSNPGPGAQPAVAKALRNSDEQTVAGAAAILRAIESRGWQGQSFRDWGVIGCPRFLGRMILGGVISRYFDDAKYSINPHIVPNFTLHATSGTASVGFTMHGPNFGVGGGPGNLPEGLLTGLSIMSEGRHPGMWLMLSQFDAEPRPDRAGKATNAGNVHVHAVALALTPGGEGIGRLRLVRRDGPASVPTVTDLIRFVSSGDGPAIFRCPVDGLGVIEFDLERGR